MYSISGIIENMSLHVHVTEIAKELASFHHSVVAVSTTKVHHGGRLSRIILGQYREEWFLLSV